MTFTFTMDAFPGKTKNNPTKKVLCEINVLEDTYNPYDDDEAETNIELTLVKDGTHTLVTLGNRIANVDYKYIASTSATSAETIGSAPVGTYAAVKFSSASDYDFSFTTGSNTNMRVIAVKDNKVIAQSADKAIPTE